MSPCLSSQRNRACLFSTMLDACGHDHAVAPVPVVQAVVELHLHHQHSLSTSFSKGLQPVSNNDTICISNSFSLGISTSLQPFSRRMQVMPCMWVSPNVHIVSDARDADKLQTVARQHRGLHGVTCSAMIQAECRNHVQNIL